MYDEGRFFTVTGWHLEGTPATIEDRTEELKRVHFRIFGERKREAKSAHQPGGRMDMADSDLIEKTKRAGNRDKFSRLWSGDWRPGIPLRVKPILPYVPCWHSGPGRIPPG